MGIDFHLMCDIYIIQKLDYQVSPKSSSATWEEDENTATVLGAALYN